MATKGIFSQPIADPHAPGEIASWSMNDVCAADIASLNVMGKIADVLSLMRRIDDISMNIVITIKPKL
jgi:hypothetical protein